MNSSRIQTDACDEEDMKNPQCKYYILKEVLTSEWMEITLKLTE